MNIDHLSVGWVPALAILGHLFAAASVPGQTAFTSDAAGNRASQSVVVAPPPPTLLTAPADQVGRLNGTARFSVIAGGSGPFTYQWFAGVSPIGGATSDTLVLTGLSAGQFTP